MKTIWKYELKITDEQTIHIPLAGRGILSAGIDPRGQVCIWAEVETEGQTPSPTTIRIIGTGNPLPEPHGFFRFVGSVQQGPFMWHIYAHLMY